MGHGQSPLRAGACRRRGARDRAAHRRERSDLCVASQARDPFWDADGSRKRHDARDRSLQPNGPDRGPARRRAGLQRETQTALQRSLTSAVARSDPMSERHPIQGPWRVEADTLPEMAYDHYRHALIHETSSIKAYLAPKHQERTVLVAPKGYGKTLLLIAKKKSVLEARSGQIVMAENRFIDRPLGIFPIIKRDMLEILSSDYEFWKSLWKISLSLSAIKAFARATRERLGDRDLAAHSWYARIISDDQKFFEAGEIFADLLGQDYKFIINIIAN